MKKTFLTRYNNGEEEIVWKEIYKLSETGKSSANWTQIEPVLIETMKRVKFNTEKIFSKLKDVNYKFQGAKKARGINTKTSEQYFSKLKKKVLQYGNIPLSLEYFYKYVGSINLIHSFKDSDLFAYKFSDPLYIEDSKSLFDIVSDESWVENIEELKQKKKKIFIQISPDFYHKDNVSGGMPYGVEITNSEQIDSLFLNSSYGKNMYFIDYLRLSFSWGGFPRISKNNKKYQQFVDYLSADLKTI